MELIFKTILLLILLVTVSQEIHGAKILSISIMSSKSHKNVYEPLLKELARRGHQVTIVTPVKASKPFPNITEIIGIPYHTMMNTSTFGNIFEMKRKKDQMSLFTQSITMFEKFGPEFFKLPQIQNVLKDNFDLILMGAFMNECIFGIIPHFNAPFIMISTIAAPSFTVASVGNPMPMSFSPVMFLGYSDRMTFFQRVKNVLATTAYGAFVKYYLNPKMEKIYRQEFGEDTPSIEEINKNVSLILGNGHFTLNYPRPLMPEVIDVGGMHCRPAEPLSKDLDDFLSGSGDDGFIYFSLGSIVQAHDMPDNIRQMFLNVFSKLKQRILWKWETGEMDGLPKNVKLGKWLPQQDILGHPKIRMFITHGGLLSTEEAVYHGVPLFGFPMFGDQEWNMQQSETMGFALSRDILDITEDDLLHTINRILNEPTFTKKAKALSATFKDRPQKPLDTAVYWTEYILRHKGAIHLRSAARDLNVFQYHSIDVISFILLSLFVVFYVLFIILRCTFRKICGSSTKVYKPKSRSKMN